VNPRPKVYIAAPFFNPWQLEIVSQIEGALDDKGYRYYSPRIHSGSASLTPEERRNPLSWRPVFESNISGLRECVLVLAVLCYPLPGNKTLRQVEHVLVEDGRKPAGVELGPPLEMPDDGVIYEMGCSKILGTPVIGFHPCKYPAQMNLMLTHGCTGFLTGWVELEAFFNGRALETGSRDWERTVNEFLARHPDLEHMAALAPWFNWKAARMWQDGVE